eukprot:13834-Heterococcus_DN1.PRE.1
MGFCYFFLPASAVARKNSFSCCCCKRPSFINSQLQLSNKGIDQFVRAAGNMRKQMFNWLQQQSALYSTENKPSAAAVQQQQDELKRLAR